MSAGSDGDAPSRGRRVADLLEREPVWAREFTDPRYEWRRWFSELFGTFLLVLAGGGAPVVDTLSQGAIGRVAAAAAPALTVLAVILFMGAVSGAHLNPVVTIAFSLRADFAWRRVPGYLAAQLVGAVAAAPCSGRCSASTRTRRSRGPAPGSRSVRRFRSRPCAA
jgi:aquaporin Z